MRSRIAGEIASARARRVAAMSPAERVALAARLGEEGIGSYISLHGGGRRGAITAIKATRQLGRRRSAAATEC